MEMNTMRTIRVTGRGRIAVRPDKTRISIVLKGRAREYAKALQQSSEDTELLKDLLSTLGFERSDLKTLSFDVDESYETYHEDNTYKRRFKGYTFEHDLKVEFFSDNQRLGKILYALAHSPIHPEFSISYFVSDPDAAKNKLLGKAVEDARKKALVLSTAAQVKLKDIQSIDYSWQQIEFEFSPMNRMMSSSIREEVLSEASYDLNIEPDDIEASDTVTIIWEIE